MIEAHHHKDSKGEQGNSREYDRHNSHQLHSYNENLTKWKKGPNKKEGETEESVKVSQEQKEETDKEREREYLGY